MTERDVAQSDPLSARAFWVALGSLVCAYLLVEALYILRLPLVMDEFQGAKTALTIADQVPYRDFRPYKTVLGYFVQLPLLILVDDWWSAMLAVKGLMATMVGLTLLLASKVLAELFGRLPTLFGLALLLPMSTFLERSAELRVDMLTALAGLACLVFLLRHQWVLAGLACGLSFCLSQKGAYYFVAAQCALGTMLLLSPDRGHSVRSYLRFTVASLTQVAAYVLLWSLVADASSVLRSTFLSAGQLALAEDYAIRWRFWSQTIFRNPVFYGLVPAAVFAVAASARRASEHALLLGFAVALLALCAWHKQPWPYFFVLLVPTIFVLHTAFLNAVLEPGRLERRVRLVFMATLLVGGVLYPVARIPVNLDRDHGLQETTLRVAEALLGPTDTYLATFELLPDHAQAMRELAWLDRPRLERLGGLSPDSLSSMARSLEQNPPALYVLNYRVRQLPRAILDVLDRDFVHLWANVYTYAPSFIPGTSLCHIGIPGRYKVRSPESGLALSIQGVTLAQDESVMLEAGNHPCEVRIPLRLARYSQSVTAVANAAYAQAGDFFPNVYSY